MSNADDKQRRLGRGLSALLPGKSGGTASAAAVAPTGSPTAAPATIASPTTLSLDSIEPNPMQPRDAFQPERLEELAASIRAHGVIQPLIVRKGGKHYQIIAGERRWRAARLAGLTEVPVVIQEIADKELLEVALIENIQREDLNPIETAIAFDRLSRELGLSQEEIGRRTGKDRTTIANLIRLLRLPQEVQNLVAGGRLSMGHARAVLSLHGPDEQLALANKAAAQGMSVRQVEHEAQLLSGDREGSQSKKNDKLDPNVKAAMEALERALGTRVRIIPQSDQRGRIEIEYYSPAELDRLYYLLAGEER
ncbi:MAG: ParB/RepB/Spo0J family partition protein [Acidobacteriota bacterium]